MTTRVKLVVDNCHAFRSINLGIIGEAKLKASQGIHVIQKSNVVADEVGRKPACRVAPFMTSSSCLSKKWSFHSIQSNSKDQDSSAFRRRES